MIKKIILTMIICCMIVSCGKKGDPAYKISEKTLLQNIYLKIS